MNLQRRENKMGNASDMPSYLLSIRGKLKSATLQEARSVHNATAGLPANVEVARALGDLSHMVYVPLSQQNGEAGEFLILDIWNKMDGLNQFFANPHVQEQAGQIFADRDPVVWAPAEGFFNYHLGTPNGKSVQVVALVRGTVSSREEALAVHNEIVANNVNAARMAGDISHQAYFRMAAPGTPEALEFFAVDTWMDVEGMAKYYDNPEFLKGFSKLFTAPPTTSVWRHPEGEWVEW
jgi:quinol monooxygenase YgiN